MTIQTIPTSLGALPNVEKSGFVRGEYVGYGLGECWAIERTGGGWMASVPRSAVAPLFGRTLADVSRQLAGGKV